MRKTLSIWLCFCFAAAGCVRAAFPGGPAATLPNRFVGCYLLGPATVLRLNPRRNELLSQIFGRTVWTVDRLDSAGEPEPLPAEWHDSMVYWSLEGTRLTIVYSSGYQGDIFRFDLAGARGDTLQGEYAEADDVGPEPAATPVTAVRLPCPGAGSLGRMRRSSSLHPRA
jgi:hypothetical protein